MQDKKNNSLVPLEDLNENPVYKGTTDLAKYIEPDKRMSFDEVLLNKEPVRQSEGRKKKSSKPQTNKEPIEEEKPKDNTEDNKNKKEKVKKKAGKGKFSISSLFSSIGKSIDKKIKERNEDKDRVQEVIRDDKPKSQIHDEEDTSKKNKDEMPRVPLFGMKKSKLEEYGYPRKAKMPIDIEVLNGNKGLYFNIEKWLEFRGLSWIAKIIPIHILDKITYNKAVFDNTAPRLHDEAIEYNQMDAQGQYKHDQKIRQKRFIKLTGTLVAIVIIVVMSVVPSYQSRSAMSLMDSAQYQEAYEAFNAINKPNEMDKFYQQYCLAMGHLQAGNYQEAKEGIMKMEGYSAPGIDLNSAMNEILYQEAEALYKEGKYADAANNLKITYNYKDSKARFLEASYKSLDELMDSEHFEEAMKMLSLLGDYKDSESIGNEFMEQLYQEAREKYDLGLYSEAEKLFYYVAQNNYKDSATMIYQAQYNAGLEFYKKKKYKKAIEQLSKIAWFKDSSAMLSNMYYTRGMSLIDDDPIKAYDSLVNCLTFKDTMEVLQRPELVLFGEWQVLNYNGSIVSDVKLDFNFDGIFHTNNPESIFIKDLKISNDKKDYKYKFRDGEYTVKGGEPFTVVSQDLNNVSLVIHDEKGNNELALRRLKPIEKTNLDMFTSIRDSLYEYIDKQLGRSTEEKSED